MNISFIFLLIVAGILVVTGVILFTLNKKTVRKSSPSATPAGSASTTPAAAAKKNAWLSKTIWAVAIILIIGLGIGSFNYFTSQESVDQKNSTTLNSKVEIKLVRNEGNRYYPITQLTRTKERISIQCAYGLILRGTGFGDNEYVGKWTQGNISGPFTLKFIDATNARGTLGETTGDIQIVIQQI